MTRIAITMGDLTGVGPEVIVKALSLGLNRVGVSFLIVGDSQVMSEAVRRYGSSALKKLWSRSPQTKSWKEVGAFDTQISMLVRSAFSFSKLVPGQPGAAEGKAMADYLTSAFDLVRTGICQALVTAPVSKAALKAAGFAYPGHTDWLAKRTGSRAVMMLVTDKLRVVPATVHIPLAAVPSALSLDLLLDTIKVVDRDLRNKFGIKSPRIALAGLNPHAGEGGMLGREEQKLISPAINTMRSQGVCAEGPFPADTLFIPENRKKYDAMICMYHDQALIAIKTVGFRRAVNVTLGLPLIRTSPAHGTGPEIAWQGKADPLSMSAAIALAVKLARSEAGSKKIGPKKGSR